MIKPCKFNELAWSLQQCNIIHSCWCHKTACSWWCHEPQVHAIQWEISSTAASFVDVVKFFAVLERELEEEALWERGEEKVLQWCAIIVLPMPLLLFAPEWCLFLNFMLILRLHGTFLSLWTPIFSWMLCHTISSSHTSIAFCSCKRFYHSPLSQLRSEKPKAADSSVWELPSEILKQNFRIGSWGSRERSRGSSEPWNHHLKFSSRRWAWAFEIQRERYQGDQVNLWITISNSEAEDEHGHLRFKGIKWTFGWAS